MATSLASIIAQPVPVRDRARARQRVREALAETWRGRYDDAASAYAVFLRTGQGDGDLLYFDLQDALGRFEAAQADCRDGRIGALS